MRTLTHPLPGVSSCGGLVAGITGREGGMWAANDIDGSLVSFCPPQANSGYVWVKWRGSLRSQFPSFRSRHSMIDDGDSQNDYDDKKR